MKKTVLTCIALLFISGPTLAEDKKEPAPETPEVSTPETPAPAAMGEKTKNIRFNPLGLLSGLLNADFDFKINDTMTLGPTIGFLSRTVGDVKTSGTSLGARMNFFLSDKVFVDGWYLGAGFEYVTATAEDSDTSASVSGTSLFVIPGYHWMWDTFNIQLGLGLQYISIPAEVDGVNISISGTAAAGEFTLGWAF